MTIEKQIEILTSYKNGKQIEYKSKHATTWLPLRDIGHEFVFSAHEYRIAIEPVYTAFSFDDRGDFRFKWVKFKDGNQEFIATAIDKTEISFGSYIISYEEAFDKLIFIDGTPFGKLS